MLFIITACRFPTAHVLSHQKWPTCTRSQLRRLQLKSASPEGTRRTTCCRKNGATRIGRIKRNAPKKHSDRPLTRATPRLRRRVFILSCRDRRPRWQKRPAACDRGRWRKRWMMKPASTAVPAPGRRYANLDHQSAFCIHHFFPDSFTSRPLRTDAVSAWQIARASRASAPDSSGEARFSAAERTASRSSDARRRQRFSISAAAPGRRW